MNGYIADLSIDIDQEAHEHDDSCIEYESVDNYYTSLEPHKYQTEYVAYCNILDESVESYRDSTEYYEDGDC